MHPDYAGPHSPQTQWKDQRKRRVLHERVLDHPKIPGQDNHKTIIWIVNLLCWHDNYQHGDLYQYNTRTCRTHKRKLWNDWKFGNRIHFSLCIPTELCHKIIFNKGSQNGPLNWHKLTSVIKIRLASSSNAVLWIVLFVLEWMHECRDL